MERADLEGYLVGVERRVATQRNEGNDDPGWERALTEARDALRRADLGAADRILRALDAELDRRRPEMEMQDRPRGLVGYTPKGDRGVPPTDEEEPLANRIRLIGRLAAVRASHGEDVIEVRRALAEARAAYDVGDRAGARRALDEAHRRLEGEPSRGAHREPS